MPSLHAWRLEAFGAPLVEAEAPCPEPRGREVLLRVRHCGVCHSDLHLREGHFDLGGGRQFSLAKHGPPLPLTLGHETVGEIVAAGAEAASEAPAGALRLVFPWIGCGTCTLCRIGAENLCARPRCLGIQLPGGYADHILVPDARYLLPIDGFDPALAATWACSGITAYGAVRKALPALEGDRIAVIGAGGVGSAALAILRALAPRVPVIAVDLDPAKREAALAAGAAAAFDAAEGGAALGRLAEGRLAVALDFVGAEATAQLATSALRKGGRYIVVGLFGGELRLPLPFIPMLGLSILGSYVGTLEEMKGLLALAGAGKLPPIPVTRRKLREVNAALDDLAAGRVTGRVVLEPT
jgi:D-arabinose 1-dehydrogenase-like Zn-dependent alcohol dehydrogenase